MAASNSYSGGTTISGGVLQLGTGQSGQDGSLNGTPAVSVASGASLVYNLYGNQTAVYPVSGGGSLVMAGPATLTLTGSNTYSGGTTISGGTLQVGNGGATGRLGSGAIVNNANLVYSLNSSTVLSLPTTATYSGSGNLTVTAGNLPFNGNLAVGGAFNYNATNGGSQVGQSTAASTVTATSASLSGAIFYNGVNSSSLRIDTSATGGPIALNSVLSGNPGTVGASTTSISTPARAPSTSRARIGSAGGPAVQASSSMARSAVPEASTSFPPTTATPR